MKGFFKGKFGTIIILLGTLILAGVAIFTAIRLYQLRQQPVAPNVPSSKPKAASASCTVSFTISTEVEYVCEPETGETWCTNHGGIALTVDHDVTSWTECLTWCKENMTASMPLCQYNADGPRNCWVNYPPTAGFDACVWQPGTPPYGSCYQATDSTPTPTPTGTAEATPTPTSPSSTPNTCNGTCGSDSNCQSGYTCSNGYCRNPSCPSDADCVCPGESALPTPTPTTQPALPESGTNWPTVLGTGFGILIIIGSLLLAL